MSADERVVLSFGDVADEYRAGGWHPFPLPAGSKQPPPSGYTGRDGADVTEADIARWCHSAGNLGLRMPAGVVGIDVDDYGTKHGAERVSELEQQLGRLPATWASTSRDDGRSGIWFYRIPAGIEFPGKPCADVEFIQRHHRYAVVYPSMHPEGRPYGWWDPAGESSERPPRVDELTALPEAWIRYFDENKPAQAIADISPVSDPFVSAIRSAPTESSRAVDKVVATYLRDAPGGRHDAMLTATLALDRLDSQGHPGAATALDGLRDSFISSVTNTYGDRMLRTPAEAEKEWDDAVKGAKRQVSTTPSTRDSYNDLTRDTSSPSRPPAGVDPVTGEITRESSVLPASWTDAHVGEAFGDTLNGRWLHCRALGGWLRWDDRRWIVDPGEAVHEEFRQWIVALGEELWKTAGNGDTMKQVAKYRERGKIDAAVTIARRLGNIAATANEFDRHPHLLNVHNGVVDLRDGSMQPHQPSLRLTKIAGASYHPGTTHSDVEVVLSALDDDVRPWMQRLLGSAAYGQVVDDTLAVCDGTGANGKTTLLKAAASALGEYATPASTRLLMARGVNDEHPTLIADLFGRRLVYIEETPEGGALKMEQVKNITGGGKLKARFIGRDYFEFEPSHQLIVATNHRPAVNASDYAAWRRLRLVPFTRTYRQPHEAKPGDLVADSGLRGRLSERAQREAMLTWIIAGAVAWHTEGGLGACASVDAATARWRRDEDVIHAWWNDRLHPSGCTPAGELYQSFVNWCALEGRRFVSSNKEFAKRFTDHDLYREHGIEKRGTAIGNVYYGVSVEGVEGVPAGLSRSSLRESTPSPSTPSTTRGYV